MLYLKERWKEFLIKFPNFFCPPYASDDAILEEFYNVRTYLANDFTIYYHSVKLIFQRVFCPTTEYFKTYSPLSYSLILIAINARFYQ